MHISIDRLLIEIFILFLESPSRNITDHMKQLSILYINYKYINNDLSKHTLIA